MHMVVGWFTIEYGFDRQMRLPVGAAIGTAIAVGNSCMVVSAEDGAFPAIITIQLQVK